MKIIAAAPCNACQTHPDPLPLWQLEMEGVQMAPRRSDGAGAFPKPVEPPAPEKKTDPDSLYAALDLGTNSCRMLIAQPEGSQFVVVDSFSKSVQLGAGLERSGRLSRSSMARTVQALKICKRKIAHIASVRRMRCASSASSPSTRWCPRFWRATR